MQSVKGVKKLSVSVLLLSCLIFIFSLPFTAQISFAGKGTAKNSEQTSSLKTIQSSVQVDLPKNKDDTIHLRAKHTTLDRILTTLSAKTGVKIHYSALPSNLITVTCAEASVKTVVECLLGPGANLATKIPEKTSEAIQALNPDAQAAELWILSAPTSLSHADSPKAETLAEQSPQPAQRKPKPQDIAERDRDQFEETLKQTTSKNPEERATALYNLGLTGKDDDPDVKDALRQALSDEAPNVREQAAISITQSGDPELIAELNKQPKIGIDADRTTDGNTLSQDVALLQKAAKGGEKMALDFIKNRRPDSQVEQ